MGSSRLVEVYERVEAKVASGVLPVVVFDLDSTLFSTRARNLVILREFSAHVQDSELDRITASLSPDDFGWDPALPLRSAGYADEAVLGRLKGFWLERFFTDAYVVHDTPLAGAVSYVRAVHDRGGFVYYLTGRHVGGMEIGTVRALTMNGFPYWRGRTTLHLKPDFHMPDKSYKDMAIADLRSHHGEVVATFENEPGNANLFQGAFPDALHFLLLTEHSPEAESPVPELIESTDFVLP